MNLVVILGYLSSSDLGEPNHRRSRVDGTVSTLSALKELDENVHQSSSRLRSAQMITVAWYAQSTYFLGKPERIFSEDRFKKGKKWC